MRRAVSPRAPWARESATAHARTSRIIRHAWRSTAGRIDGLKLRSVLRPPWNSPPRWHLPPPGRRQYHFGLLSTPPRRCERSAGLVAAVDERSATSALQGRSARLPICRSSGSIRHRQRTTAVAQPSPLEMSVGSRCRQTDLPHVMPVRLPRHHSYGSRTASASVGQGQCGFSGAGTPCRFRPVLAAC